MKYCIRCIMGIVYLLKIENTTFITHAITTKLAFNTFFTIYCNQVYKCGNKITGQQLVGNIMLYMQCLGH